MRSSILLITRITLSAIFWSQCKLLFGLWGIQERNIQLIAYSPLASGLLTDKALGRTDGKATKVWVHSFSLCYIYMYIYKDGFYFKSNNRNKVEWWFVRGLRVICVSYNIQLISLNILHSPKTRFPHMLCALCPEQIITYA